MKQAKIDPRVSCPIVCGEYMRATGFFFATDAQTYLVTARHNLLPTTAAKLATGNLRLSFETNDDLPIIDLYLQDTESRTQHRIDIRETGVRCHDQLDVVGIPLDLIPEDYGYTVWTAADIIAPDATNTSVDSIGFPGQSLPSAEKQYDPDIYEHDITNPCLITLQTTIPPQYVYQDDTGLIEFGLDTDNGTRSSEYDGFSGSPVLGDGLAGIHMSNVPLSTANRNTGKPDKKMGIHYWRADILPKILE